MLVRKERNIKKQLALTMRRNSISYKEIIDKLHVAKSTLSDWINSGLSKEEEMKIKSLTTKRGRNKIIKFNKKRSLIIKKNELKEQVKYSHLVTKIDKEKLFWLGMGLYMAEGAKTDRWKAVFYNSDASLNKVMMCFFRKICHVSDEKIHIQLVLHRNVSEVVARSYWSKILGISEKNFYNASFALSRSSKGKRPKERLPFGTVQISISGKDIANKVKGWTIGIEKQISRLRV